MFTELFTFLAFISAVSCVGLALAALRDSNRNSDPATTATSRTEYAAKLRYTPNWDTKIN